MAAALSRRVQTEGNSYLTEAQKARGRLNSLTYALTRCQEIPSTMAAFYLTIADSPAYTNLSFAPLFHSQAVSFLRNQPFFARLVPTGNRGQHIPSAFIFDYIYRPDSLNDLCLLEFVKVDYYFIFN